MKFLIGVAGAIVTWFLSTGIFAWLDQTFGLSATHHWLSILFFAIPIGLAWVAYHLTPGLLADLVSALFRGISDHFQTPKDTPSSVLSNASSSVEAPARVMRHYVSFPDVVDGTPLVYYYPNNLLSNLNTELFETIVFSDDYAVDIEPDNSGGATVRKDGAALGTIQSHGAMISDWLRRGDLLLCKVTAATEGKEAVGLAFYRDDEARLSGCNTEKVRLTKNRSADMQDALSFLSDGEKLRPLPEYIEEADSILLIRQKGEEVGCLPKKFNKINDEHGIRGVFVDHVEEDDSMKYVAYVRVYW